MKARKEVNIALDAKEKNVILCMIKKYKQYLLQSKNKIQT